MALIGNVSRSSDDLNGLVYEQSDILWSVMVVDSKPAKLLDEVLTYQDFLSSYKLDSFVADYDYHDIPGEGLALALKNLTTF